MKAIADELSKAKDHFRKVVAENGGTIGVWTADEYIEQWSEDISAIDLIERLYREAYAVSLPKPFPH